MALVHPPQAQRRALRPEEMVSLAIAAALHVGVVALMLLQPDPLEIPPQPERMTVTLSSDVSLASTAPDPVPESRAATAPTLSENPAPPLVQDNPIRPIERTIPDRTEPQPRAQPTSRATPRSQPTRQPRTQPTRTPRTEPTTRAATPARQTGGGSRISDDFLGGQGSSNTQETRVPASEIGNSTKASLLSQITREVRPKFDPPSGVEVDKLVSVVRFNLDENGALRGEPRLVRQTGVTDANRPQASRHSELAIRAVKLASPFDLPKEYYEAFKTVTLNFDASL